LKAALSISYLNKFKLNEPLILYTISSPWFDKGKHCNQKYREKEFVSGGRPLERHYMEFCREKIPVYSRTTTIRHLFGKELTA
jgi:hypothetical protein